METIQKDTFIAQQLLKIQIYQDFIKAFDILIENTKKFDGKKLNARFINFLNPIIKDVVPGVEISFDEWSNGERTGRLKLYHSVTYIPEVNSYIERERMVLYHTQGDYNRKPYLSKDFIFDYNIFRAVCNEYIIYCQERIKDMNRCINEIDDIIERYSLMESALKEFIKSLPEQFYRSIDFKCPVYE